MSADIGFAVGGGGSGSESSPLIGSYYSGAGVSSTLATTTILTWVHHQHSSNSCKMWTSTQFRPYTSYNYSYWASGCWAAATAAEKVIATFVQKHKKQEKIAQSCPERASYYIVSVHQKLY